MVDTPLASRGGTEIGRGGTPMAAERLLHLQRCVLAWLVIEEQRTHGGAEARPHPEAPSLRSPPRWQDHHR